MLITSIDLSYPRSKSALLGTKRSFAANTQQLVNIELSYEDGLGICHSVVSLVVNGLDGQDQPRVPHDEAALQTIM
jgi:hypothetical protein